MEEETDTEPTLSLSLVDGLSCALAAIILLFLLFSVSLESFRTSERQAVTEQPGRSGPLRGVEPIDIEVRFTNPIGADLLSHPTGWVVPQQSDDRVILARPPEADGLAVGPATEHPAFAGFVRRLNRGFMSVGKWTSTREAAFDISIRQTVPIPGRAVLSGSIVIHQSTSSAAFKFICEHQQPTYHVITRIDKKTGTPRGECEVVDAHEIP